MDIRFGTDKQREYASELMAALGIADLPTAISQVAGIALQPDQDINLSTTEASAIISGLQARFDERFPGKRLHRSNGKSSLDPVEAKGARNAPGKVEPSRPDSSQLRRWAERIETFDPSSLDADSIWLLTRLAQYAAVVAATRDKDALKADSRERKAVNGNEPIRVDQVLDFFEGSEEDAAKAMDVSISTFRAWGTYIPPQRSWQAEVVTGGRVRAPRRQPDPSLKPS